MENTIPKKQMDVVLADMMKNDLSGIRGLLVNNGISGANSFNDKDSKIAFLKAIKDSASFRNDLSTYLTNKLQGKHNFIRQPMAQDFLDQPKLNYVSTDDITTAGSATEPTTSTTGTTTTTTQKSSFWSTLGGLASKENLQSLFNTGLNVASTSLQNKANKESEERALELERLRLEQIQAQKDLAASGGLNKGLSTGAWIGIGAGAVGLIVLVIVLTRRKK
jgi:hypothetical protein